MELTLQLEPTFDAPVLIPIPGKGEGKLKFTFKYRTKTEFKEFMAGRAELSDLDYVLAVATGWGMKEAFNAENITRLFEKYAGAPAAIASTYTLEMMGARLKN